MRIVVTHWRDIANASAGGAENLLLAICQELVAEGHDVLWYCPNPGGLPSNELVSGIEVARRGGRFSAYLLLPWFLMLRRFDFHPDLVLDSITGIPWFTPLFCGKRTMALIYHLGKSDTFLAELPSSEGLLGYALALVAILAEKALSLVYRSTEFLTFSQDTKHDLVAAGIPAANVRVAQEGIDLNRYHRSQDRFRRPTAIYVGRLVASKGLEHLVLAMPLVIREVPDARLIIVGRGSFRPHLESLVDRLGLGSSVEFAGFVGEDEKIDLISRSHVLVHPSMREGWATPVTEANACGVIAVGSDTEGVRSAIVAGVTGLLFRYGDSKGIAECIIKVLKDKEMRELMEANALRFSSQFSLSLTKRMASTVILNHAERNRKSPSVSTGKDLR